jgi:hypothetical protein
MEVLQLVLSLFDFYNPISFSSCICTSITLLWSWYSWGAHSTVKICGELKTYLLTIQYMPANWMAHGIIIAELPFLSNPSGLTILLYIFLQWREGRRVSESRVIVIYVPHLSEQQYDIPNANHLLVGCYRHQLLVENWRPLNVTHARVES